MGAPVLSIFEGNGSLPVSKNIDRQYPVATHVGWRYVAASAQSHGATFALGVDGHESTASDKTPRVDHTIRLIRPLALGR